MARKSKHTNVGGRRDVLTPIAKPERLPSRQVQPSLQRPVFRFQPSLFDSLPLEVEDNRRFHPSSTYRTPRALDATAARLRADGSLGGSRDFYHAPYVRAFSEPQDVLVCVRRKVREQVMHALKHAGKRGQRKPRRGLLSNVRCK